MHSPIPKNIISSEIEESYGPTAYKQFGALSRKYGYKFEDIVQDAYVILLEKTALYDPRIGSFRSFLWSKLRCLIRRVSIGPLRYFTQLDELDEDEHPLQTDLYALSNLDEATEIELLKKYPELKDCINFAKKIAGMSSSEAAQMLGLTKRAFNYQLKKLCETAKNIRKNNNK